MAEEKKTYSKEDVVKAWSELSGRKDQYEVREVEGTDGQKGTQLVDKDTGSLTVEVHATGEDAYRQLMEKLGTPYADSGTAPKQAVEDNEVEFTERGARITPTQPEALEGEKPAVEVDTSDRVKTDNQTPDKTPNQESQPEVRKAKK